MLHARLSIAEVQFYTEVSSLPEFGCPFCLVSLRRLAWYCTKECQVAAWKGGHKTKCKTPSETVGLRCFLLLYDACTLRKRITCKHAAVSGRLYWNEEGVAR